MPVDAFEKRVGLDLVASRDFTSHQSTDQITSSGREGTGEETVVTMLILGNWAYVKIIILNTDLNVLVNVLPVKDVNH